MKGGRRLGWRKDVKGDGGMPGVSEDVRDEGGTPRVRERASNRERREGQGRKAKGKGETLNVGGGHQI